MAEIPHIGLTAIVTLFIDWAPYQVGSVLVCCESVDEEKCGFEKIHNTNPITSHSITQLRKPNVLQRLKIY